MAHPPSDDPRVHPVCVRLTLSEYRKLEKDRKGKPVSEFVRSKLFGK